MTAPAPDEPARSTFRATLRLDGRTATGIVVPDEVVERLGGGGRPAVTVTIRGITFSTTVASRGGEYKLPVSGERRAAVGIEAGDEFDVEISLDTAPRAVEVPDDLARALAGDAAAAAAFAALTASQQKGFAVPVAQAKKPETRQRRIDSTLEKLRSGAKRP